MRIKDNAAIVLAGHAARDIIGEICIKIFKSFTTIV